MRDPGRTTPTRSASFQNRERGHHRIMSQATALHASLVASGAIEQAAIVQSLIREAGTRAGNDTAEERAAWDAYAASMLALDETVEHAAMLADEMLAMRRERFRRGEQ